MRLTKQNKIYGAVLGLAVAAFAADRFAFSGSPAEAADAPVAAVVAAKRPTQAVSPVAAVADGSILAARLRAAAGSAGMAEGEVRDAFVPSQQWVSTGAAGVAVPEADEFVRAHRLTATINGKRSVLAVVDGRALRPGQAYDGFTLVSVGDKSAVFARGEARATLKIQVAEFGASQSN